VNKIIFVNRYFYPDISATSQMVSDLAFALTSHDHRVSVVTSRQTYENPRDRLPSRQTYSEVEIHRAWTTRFGRMSLIGRAFDYITFYLSAFFILLRITQPGDVIVAKTDPPLISVIAWIVTRLKRARLVNWLQDVFPEVAVALGVLSCRPLVWMLRWLRNLSLRGAVMNVVLGERMQDRICMLGVARSKTVIIHNWADANLIRPVPRGSNTLRKDWNIQDKFVVGYSGNMGRAHEFDTIIDAMKRLRNDSGIVFLFIGGGAEKIRLERAAKELDLNNCIFRPYQKREHLAESLSVPDVHLASLLPPLEGLIVPSKVYGIAAAGRPIVFVGDPDGEIGKLVNRCKFGFTVPIGEGGELAQRLLKLKQTPEVAVQMGNNGRQCLMDYYERSIAVAAWRGLFVQIGESG
jgi:glycosyltransferase involved in cell wall biosynthesis